MTLYYCEGCHKVFFYRIASQAPKECPNCYAGRYHHDKYYDEGIPRKIETSDIRLKKISDEP